MRSAAFEIANQVANSPTGTRILPVGAGTKPALSAANPDTELARIDMRSLSGVVAYDPSEFLITAGAGTSLRELATTLAETGSFSPSTHYLSIRDRQSEGRRPVALVVPDACFTAGCATL